MWTEIGFYEGFALAWKAIYARKNPDVPTDELVRPYGLYFPHNLIVGLHSRAINHINHLLTLIDRFPRVNPSPNEDVPSPESTELDIEKLFQQIRSRYKALCSTLGVKPNLPTFGNASSHCAPPLHNASSPKQNQSRQRVWALDNNIEAKPQARPDLSF
jgi:hypothetical protein